MRGLLVASLISLVLVAPGAIACGGGPSCDEDALPGLCVGEARPVGLGGAIAQARVVDLDGDGVDELVAIDPRVAALVIAGADGQARSLRLAGEPSALAIGELTGDGIVDVAVALRTADAVAILAGDGAGGLALASTHAVGRSPRDLWLGDLDGDGAAELITADAGEGALSLLRGQDRRRRRIAAGEAPSRLAAADLDGDGRPEVLALDFTGGALLRLPVGDDGALGAATPILVDPEAATIAAADLDGDGRGDLVTQSGVDGRLTLRFGDGDGDSAGGLGEAVALAAGGAPAPGVAAIAAAAGEPGAIVAAVGDAIVTWSIEPVQKVMPPTRRAGEGVARGLHQAGPRALVVDAGGAARIDDLAAEVSLAATWGERSAASAHVYVSGEPGFGDLDGDGHLDFAVNTWRDGIVTYHGDGRGGFAARAVVPAPPGYLLTIADVVGDGRPALIVAAEDTLWIAAQGADGGFTPAPTIGLRGDARDLAALRGGARARIALDLGPEGIDVLTIGPGGALLAAITPRPELKATRLRAADLAGDGDDDLVILGATAGVRGLSTILSEGTGFIAGPTLAQATIFGDDEAQLRALAVGDLDGDGTIDAVLAADDRIARIHDLAGAAPTVAIDPVEYDPELTWGPLSVGDLDGDGALDLLRPHRGDLVIHRGAPGRGFDPLPELRVFAAEPRILPADLQRDARVDFVTKDERELRAFVGEARQVPRPRGRWPLAPALRRLHVGDLEGDGAVEIVAIGAGGVAVIADPERPGERMIAALERGAVIAGALADLEGDGAIEIVIALAGPAPALRVLRVIDGALVDEALDLGAAIDTATITDLLAGDLDGDGDGDLLFLRGEAAPSIAHGAPGGGYEAPEALPGLAGARAFMGDLDGDGRRDLLLVDADAGGHRVAWQDPDRRWIAGPAGEEPALLRGDGELLALQGSRLVRAPLRGRDALPPLTLADDPDLEGARLLAAGDLDGDGRSDLVTADDAAIVVWLDRHGALVRSARRRLDAAHDLVIADLDRRGRGELIGVDADGLLWILRGEAP